MVNVCLDVAVNDNFHCAWYTYTASNWLSQQHSHDNVCVQFFLKQVKYDPTCEGYQNVCSNWARLSVQEKSKINDQRVK